MTNFSKKLQELLQAVEIKQADLARLLEVDPRNINHYVKGRREPDLDTLKKIADSLSVPVGYFFGEITLDEVLQIRLKNKDSLFSLSEKLEAQSSDQLVKYIELLALSEKKHFKNLLNILKELDEESIFEILKQAEKEKNNKNYKKLISQKDIS